ncbi:hypothetical protein MRX96_006088 [Rhipicephalus microplus]
MGRHALEYTSLIPVTPVAGLLSIPPNRVSCLSILTRVTGIRSKGLTTRATLLQETCALIEDWYSEKLHLYTDGLINRDGSSAAASISPAP